MGLELIRKVRGEEAFALTWPLLLRADGTKYGKSESGAVWLDPAKSSPYAMYQFFVRTPDEDVGILLRQFTFLSREEIEGLEADTKQSPQERKAQQALARAVCSLVHGEAETGQGSRGVAGVVLRGRRQPSTRRCSSRCSATPRPRALGARASRRRPRPSSTSLVSTGLAPSKTAARTAIAQGGVYVNNRRRNDAEARIGRDDLLADRYVVLRRGRRDYHLLRFE